MIKLDPLIKKPSKARALEIATDALLRAQHSGVADVPRSDLEELFRYFTPPAPKVPKTPEQ